MNKRKVNIGLALTENYNKVTLELLEEEITFENEAEFAQKVKVKTAMMRQMIKEEFEEIKK